MLHESLFHTEDTLSSSCEKVNLNAGDECGLVYAHIAAK